MGRTFEHFWEEMCIRDSLNAITLKFGVNL